MAIRGLKIGEVAKRAGVSIRTLHHYEAVGLLVPSMRTGAGHRLYSQRDVQRLVRVVMLKKLGLPLVQIGEYLERRGNSLRGVMEKQLELLRQKMVAEMELCRRLEIILRRLGSAETVSVEELFDVLEQWNMVESYYTPEQLEQLEKRRETLGEEKITEAQREWPELIRKVEGQMKAGADPADPAVQALAERWKELVEQFTGGDPGIRESLGKLWKARGPEMAGKMGMGFDPAVFRYVQSAQEIARRNSGT